MKIGVFERALLNLILGISGLRMKLSLQNNDYGGGGCFTARNKRRTRRVRVLIERSMWN
ncbi:unnamed protein product [Brassica rapa subsp. trilocularis]